jgi:hypothetical protein
MKRVAEMVLGLIGSLFAFGSSFFALLFGAVDEAVKGSASEISTQGGTSFVFSAIALIASILVNWMPKFMGILMIISGVVILVATGLFGVVPAILLVIGGLMGIFRKKK